MEPTTELRRDCEAVQIPVGNTVILPAGTAIEISQTLGGSFTVHAMGGLFRIDRENADALGAADSEEPPQPAAVDTGEVNESAVWGVLRTCYDPEIPVNIVDLGLVYDLRVETIPDQGKRVSVKMTLTAPGCGMGGVIARDAQEKILFLPGVQEAEVEIVWDPPWNQSMITPEGRQSLGLD